MVHAISRVPRLLQC